MACRTNDGFAPGKLSTALNPISQGFLAGLLPANRERKPAYWQASPQHCACGDVHSAADRDADRYLCLGAINSAARNQLRIRQKAQIDALPSSSGCSMNIPTSANRLCHLSYAHSALSAGRSAAHSQVGMAPNAYQTPCPVRG